MYLTEEKVHLRKVKIIDITKVRSTTQTESNPDLIQVVLIETLVKELIGVVDSQGDHIAEATQAEVLHLLISIRQIKAVKATNDAKLLIQKLK